MFAIFLVLVVCPLLLRGVRHRCDTERCVPEGPVPCQALDDGEVQADIRACLMYTPPGCGSHSAGILARMDEIEEELRVGSVTRSYPRRARLMQVVGMQWCTSSLALP